MPPCATSNRPGLFSTAPVNALLNVPKQFAFEQVFVQRTAVHANKRTICAHLLSLCTAFAMTSFPVPVSPMRRTCARSGRGKADKAINVLHGRRACQLFRAAAARIAHFLASSPCFRERKRRLLAANCFGEEIGYHRMPDDATPIARKLSKKNSKRFGGGEERYASGRYNIQSPEYFNVHSSRMIGSTDSTM